MLRTALSITLTAAVLPCSAQSPDRLVVVLDTSERMARGGPGGVEIGEMVSTALAQSMEAMSKDEPAVAIALRTAGGGAATPPESDPCSSTALVLPLAEPDPERWTESLAALEWSGPCPLLEATAAAIGDLESESGPVRVVVITAGDDSCDGTTADVTAAMASREDPVELRLVGLGLKPEVLERFAGIPQRNATSESTLTAALGWALAETGLDDSSPAEPPAPSATVAAPQQVVAGGSIDVDWTGPERAEDFISIAPAGAEGADYNSWFRTEPGVLSALTAPREPGEYEIRYVDGETGEILARSPIEITGIEVDLDAPAFAAPGRRVTVHWEGPDTIGDMVALSRPDAPVDLILDWATTATGSPVTLAAPIRPGSYEIRYITGHGTEIIARMQIEVRQ